jgi:hypothetical protein
VKQEAPDETRYYFVAPSPRRSTPFSNVAPLLSQRLRTLMRHRGRFLNQDVERSLARAMLALQPALASSGDQFATVSANLPSTTPANASPAQAAVQSNPHRRPTAHQPPRVLSSEAFGRRPPTLLYRSTTGRHPKPFTEAVVSVTAIEQGSSTLTRSFTLTTEWPNLLRRLVRRLPLHPALHACVLADGHVEPHPRRTLEMRTEDRARREHDAVALRFFRQRQ